MIVHPLSVRPHLITSQDDTVATLERAFLWLGRPSLFWARTSLLLGLGDQVGRSQGSSTCTHQVQLGTGDAAVTTDTLQPSP